MKNLFLVAAALVVIIGHGAAQTPQPISLNVHEGTMMAAALSPDGRTLVIDLQGTLWALPATGGTAKPITDVYLDARQPTWAPDNQRIAFQGYRDGIWHIYVANADGSGLRALTSGPFDDREPSWSRDGARIAFSSDRSGNYDIWELTVATGAVRQITRNSGNDYAPAFSPINMTIAFASDRDDRRGVWTVDPATGTETSIAAVGGLVNAPSWSPDGARIVFNHVANDQSDLVLDGKAITSKEDVFPFRVQWASATDFVYTADGKIKRRSLNGGQVQTIEFTAPISFTRTPYKRLTHDFDSRDAKPVRGIMSPVISPDGTQVAFAALGDLWLMPIPSTSLGASGGSTARRLTNDRFVEMDPTWSPDGKSLAYSSDRDGAMGIWVRDLASGADRKVASDATKAAWAPRGTEIAYLTGEGALAITGRNTVVNPAIREPGRPTWAPEGLIALTALQPYSTRFREGTNQVLMVSTTGAPVRRVDPVAHHSIGTREHDGPVWSRDGSKMAFVMDGLLQVMAVTPTGEFSGTPRPVSTDIADSPSWAADSRHLLYQTWDRLKLVDVVDNKTVDVPINLTWTPSIPTGRLVIHAARVFDGKTPSLRSGVDIVIRDNRIEQVAAHGAALHTGRVIDAGDGVVMPGLIEMHTHLSKDYGEKLGRIWLSYGITSVRNPAAEITEALEDRESWGSGARVGPRPFTTGAPFDGSRIFYPGGVPVNGDRQLTAELDRTVLLGYDFIKTYVRLNDTTQKQVIDFAHAHGMPVTSHEIYPAVASGADGVEHIRGTSRRGYSPKVSALNYTYQDVIDLLTASKMTITPTANIQGWFPLVLARDPSRIDDPRFRTLFPASVIRAMDAQAKAIKLEELPAREAAVRPQLDTIRKVVKGGGIVIAGTDSPIFPYALAFHTELELFQMSGLSPFEVLQTATTRAAEALGEGANLGSIEAGKLADMVIVADDPLADVKNARKVRTVIRNGAVYTLDELLKR